MFEDDDALFSLDAPTPRLLEEKKIDQQQVLQIVKAFQDAGIPEESAQRAIVDTCVFRPYDSLQDLLAKDVRPILNRIQSGSSRRTGTVGGSAWDNRESDTWIDKM